MSKPSDYSELIERLRSKHRYYSVAGATNLAADLKDAADAIEGTVKENAEVRKSQDELVQAFFFETTPAPKIDYIVDARGQVHKKFKIVFKDDIRSTLDRT